MKKALKIMNLQADDFISSIKLYGLTTLRTQSTGIVWEKKMMDVYRDWMRTSKYAQNYAPD
jgi:hypothetical protein